MMGFFVGVEYPDATISRAKDEEKIMTYKMFGDSQSYR